MYIRDTLIKNKTIFFTARQNIFAGNLLDDGSLTDIRSIWEGAGLPKGLTASPDGSSLAFAIESGGLSEVFLLDRNDLSFRQLTSMGSSTEPVAWDRAHGLICTTTHFTPILRDRRVPYKLQRLCTADIATGECTPMELGLCSFISVHPDGQRFLLLRRSGLDYSFWKNYQGGLSGRIWIGRFGNNELTELDLPKGEIGSAMWLEDGRILFSQGTELGGNLYAYDPSTRQILTLTHFKGSYVRHVSTDGKDIVFTLNGEIYRLTPEGAARLRIAKGLCNVFPEPVIDLQKRVGEFDVSNEGAIILACQGQLLLRNPEGQHRSFAEEGACYFCPRFLPCDGTVAAIRYEAIHNRYTLSLFSHELVLQKANISLGDATYPKFCSLSPDGKKLALGDTNRKLWLVSFKEEVIQPVGVPESATELHEGTWSVDSNHYIFSVGVGVFRWHPTTSALYSVQAESGNCFQLTSGNFQDWSPTINPEGKLFFIGTRGLEPELDGVLAQPIFSASDCICALPSSIVSQITREDVDDNVEFVMPSRMNLSRIVALEGGFVAKKLGAFYRDKDETSPGELGFISSKSLTWHSVHKSVKQFRVSPNGKYLCLSTENQLFLSLLDDTESVSCQPLHLDFNNILKSAPATERLLVVNEATNILYRHLWSGLKHPDDRISMIETHKQMVGRACSDLDVIDIVSEILGDAGTSHCNFLYSNYAPDGVKSRATIGLRFVRKGDEWFVDGPVHSKVVLPANPVSLAAVKQIPPGSRALSIDGIILSGTTSPETILVGKVGKEVSIHFQPPAPGSKQLSVNVVPWEESRRPLYHQWTDEKASFVSQVSQGRIGYLHIPNMGLVGYAEFIRQLPLLQKYQMAIVDLRGNSGGSYSTCFMDFFARQDDAIGKSRVRGTRPYAGLSIPDPFVVLIDEQSLSDAEIFLMGLRNRRRFLMLGARTWGGIVGYWSLPPLSNKGEIVVGEFRILVKNGEEWNGDVENKGIDPDVELISAPTNDLVFGRDLQLEKAVSLLVESEKKLFS